MLSSGFMMKSAILPKLRDGVYNCAPVTARTTSQLKLGAPINTTSDTFLGPGVRRTGPVDAQGPGCKMVGPSVKSIALVLVVWTQEGLGYVRCPQLRQFRAGGRTYRIAGPSPVFVRADDDGDDADVRTRMWRG